MASKGVSRLDPEGSRKKRERNKNCSIALLKANGFEVEQKSDTHFFVSRDELKAMIWPTTGQYAIMTGKPKLKYKRGVFCLMKEMGVLNPIREIE